MKFTQFRHILATFESDNRIIDKESDKNFIDLYRLKN